MSAAFVIDMDALAEAIDKLPGQLQAEADRVVSDAARRTAARVRAQYRQARSDSDTFTVNGKKLTRKHLADAVTTKATSKNLGSVSARVSVNAPHAHLYEYGTGVRATKSGANRGAAPPHPTLVPAAIAERQVMVSDIVTIVEAAGFEVARSV